jgi:excisionase family DNA binding protein
MSTPVKSEQQHHLLTIRETTKYMRCSNTKLWDLRKQGTIKTCHVGAKVLIPKASIDAYLGLNN